MRTVTSVGISLILIGVATLTARKLLGTMLVDELAANDSAKPAVNAVWEIGTGLLKTMAVASVGYGVVILAGTVLAGPTRAATAGAASLAPGVAGSDVGEPFGTSLLLLVLIGRGPTPALHEALGIVLIAAW